MESSKPTLRTVKTLANNATFKRAKLFPQIQDVFEQVEILLHFWSDQKKRTKKKDMQVDMKKVADILSETSKIFTQVVRKCHSQTVEEDHQKDLINLRRKAALYGVGGQPLQLSRMDELEARAEKLKINFANVENGNLDSRLGSNPSSYFSRKRSRPTADVLQTKSNLLTPRQAMKVLADCKDNKARRGALVSKLIHDKQVPVKRGRLYNLYKQYRAAPESTPELWGQRGISRKRVHLTDENLFTIHRNLTGGGKTYGLQDLKRGIHQFVLQRCRQLGLPSPPEYSDKQVTRFRARILGFSGVGRVSKGGKVSGQSASPNVRTVKLLAEPANSFKKTKYINSKNKTSETQQKLNQESKEKITLIIDDGGTFA